MNRQEKLSMPWLQYFGAVGFCLLAAMFAGDAYLPKAAPRPDPARDHGIRIASKKVGPEAVVFSGQSVDYGVQVPLAIVHADQNASTRQSFASADVPDVQSSAKKRPGNRTRPTKN
jgi:hypothetical protein